MKYVPVKPLVLKQRADTNTKVENPTSQMFSPEVTAQVPYHNGRCFVDCDCAPGNGAERDAT